MKILRPLSDVFPALKYHTEKFYWKYIYKSANNIAKLNIYILQINTYQKSE